MDDLIFLGIESSCDDTAAAIVTGDRRILSSIVSSQTALHADFGASFPKSPRAPMPNGWIWWWNRRWPDPALACAICPASP